MNLGSSGRGAPGKVLVDAANIDHAADGIGVLEGDLAIGRLEDNRADGKVEPLGDFQRAHIADP